MSWSTGLEYKGTGTGSAASIALTLSGTAFAAGDFVVVMWEGFAGSGPTSATITDNSSGGPNTWTADLFSQITNRSVAIWSTTITHGGSSLTFTVTPNSAAAQNISVHHYASPGSGIVLESASTNHASGSSVITCGSLTIATGPDLVVAFADNGTVDMVTAGTGFTLRTDLTPSADFQSSEDQLNVTSGLNPGFPFTTGSWSAAAAAYKFGVAASFTIAPTAIPSHHSGNITLTLAGSGTNWDGTTVFTPSGVSGVTKISQNVTSAIAATVVVTTGSTTGTLTITESVTGTALATTTVGTPSFTISPTSGFTGATPTITFTGTNTVWSQETAAGLFTLSGGTGSSIGTPTVTTNTAATATLTVGSATATETITDTSVTGSTANFSAIGVSLAVLGLYGDISTSQYVVLTGTNTSWLSTTPTFTISGAGNSIGSFIYDSDTSSSAYLACGSTPGTYTLTDPSTGATCSFTIQAASITDITDASIYGHYVQIEGYAALESHGGSTIWTGKVPCCSIRFRATCSQIDVFAISSAFDQGRLSIDGVRQGTSPIKHYLGIDSGGVIKWQTIFTGLDPSTEHEYKVYFGEDANVRMFCYKIRTFGGTGINTSAVLTTRPLVMGIGDSVMSGAGCEGNDSTLCFMTALSMISSYQIANMALGTGFISTAAGSGTPVVSNLGNFSGRSPAPRVVYFLDGAADAIANYSGGQFTQFGADYLTCIQAFAADYPSALIICPDIQPPGPTAPDLAHIAPYNAQIQAAIITASNPNIVHSSVIYNLVIATGLTGYHPNAAQSAVWAAAMKAEIDGLLGQPWIYGDQIESNAMG